VQDWYGPVLVEWLARHIDRLAGKTEPRLIVVLCITIALLSAFIINTATVAIFIPVAIMLAKSRKLSSSRVLMPLSFASQFGGVCTLIGSSTNILINSIATSNGMEAFEFFEFGPLGLVMTVAGISYLTIARWFYQSAREKNRTWIDITLLTTWLNCRLQKIPH
jgi:di/tricarboxylate transporter